MGHSSEIKNAESAPVHPRQNGNTNTQSQQDNFQIQTPSISLPKGGGALKGIDEKFQVNAVNGTSSFSIPLPFSKSRSQFGPLLTLTYNSGAGNSPFGLGWSC